MLFLFVVYTFPWLPFTYLCTSWVFILILPFSILIWALFIFFPLYLSFFIKPVIPLLPFFISHHLTSNCCYQFLNILPLSFTCFLILITSLLIIFSVENMYVYYHIIISDKIYCSNPNLILCMLYFPATVLKTSLPIFVLKLPTTTVVSCVGIL